MAKKAISKHNLDIIVVVGKPEKFLASDAICAVLANKSRSSDLFSLLKASIISFIRGFYRQSKYPEVLILECRVDKAGDIKHLLSIAKPRIGVLAAIDETPPQNLSSKDEESFLKEKIRLMESLPSSGFALLNSDDKQLSLIRSQTKARIITFGFGKEADIIISNFENRVSETEAKGVSFKIEYQGSFVPIFLKNVYGERYAYAAAAAFGAGIIYNLNLVEIAELLEKNYIPTPQ